MPDQDAQESGATAANSRDPRLAAIKALQKARGSDALIVYITSTRQGVNVQMAGTPYGGSTTSCRPRRSRSSTCLSSATAVTGPCHGD